MVHPEESDAPGASEAAPPRNLEDLVFVAFNSRVFAVDRYDGTIIWRFKITKGSGFVALLLDGDRLVVSSNGYTHCLDPWRGTELWAQVFSGEGIGIPSIASVRGGATAAAPAAGHLASLEQQKRSGH